jgi:methionyl-tRNA formyltransferase
MNLVFVGASKFGMRCLKQAFATPRVRVVGVVTAPRTFSISYNPIGVTNVMHANMTSFAENHDMPCVILSNGMNDACLFETVGSWKPDLFLVAGWYHMIPRKCCELAPAYGLHASLLPDYSGGAPLVWAMINGETKTGITLFKMDDGIDSGPVAAQAEEIIRDDDTIATLYGRIEERGLELLRVALPELAHGASCDLRMKLSAASCPSALPTTARLIGMPQPIALIDSSGPRLGPTRVLSVPCMIKGSPFGQPAPSVKSAWNILDV